MYDWHMRRSSFSARSDPTADAVHRHWRVFHAGQSITRAEMRYREPLHPLLGPAHGSVTRRSQASTGTA